MVLSWKKLSMLRNRTSKLLSRAPEPHTPRQNEPEAAPVYIP